jgi:hypothetical protein
MNQNLDGIDFINVRANQTGYQEWTMQRHRQQDKERRQTKQKNTT